MEQKKRIVFLVGGYYPTFTPPGICAEKIIAHLKDRCDITVVCWRRSMEVLNPKFDHEGVHVIQVSDFLNDRLASAKTVLGRRFWRIVRLGLSALRLNDSLAWARRAMLRELLSLHRDVPFSAIVSVAFPLQTHEAAAAFRIRHPEVRWITYSTDTHHGKTDGCRLLRPFRERSERNCYAQADANFLSREIYTSCVDFLGPAVMAKSRMLDYMVDLKAASDGDDRLERPFPEDEIALVFGGAFIEGVRSPEYMLELLERLPSESRIRCHVYSNQGFRSLLETFATRHPGRLVLHAPVGIDEFRRIMRGADILVNVSNDSDQFFPSKAFEYVATGRPIVDLAYPGRAVNEIFRRHPKSLRIEIGAGPDADARRLDEFCAEHAGARITSEILSTLYADYLPENVLAPVLCEMGERCHESSNQQVLSLGDSKLIRDRFEKLKFLLSLFDEDNIEYVLVGETADYLSNDLSGDVDIVVNRSDIKRISSVFRQLHERYDIRLVHVYRHEIGVFGALLSWRCNNTWNRLGPDICADYYRNGHLLLKSEELLSGRRRDPSTGFWMPTPEINFAYYLVKKIDKGHLSDNQTCFLNDLLTESSLESSKRILSRWFLPAEVETICTRVIERDPSALKAILPELQKTLRKHTRPGVSIRLRDFCRKVSRLSQPCGVIFIANIPDKAHDPVCDAWMTFVAPFFRRASVFPNNARLFRFVMSALKEKWHSNAILIPASSSMGWVRSQILRTISDQTISFDPGFEYWTMSSTLLESVIQYLSNRTERRFNWKSGKGHPNGRHR